MELRQQLILTFSSWVPIALKLKPKSWEYGRIIALMWLTLGTGNLVKMKQTLTLHNSLTTGQVSDRTTVPSRYLQTFYFVEYLRKKSWQDLATKITPLTQIALSIPISHRLTLSNIFIFLSYALIFCSEKYDSTRTGWDITFKSDVLVILISFLFGTLFLHYWRPCLHLWYELERFTLHENVADLNAAYCRGMQDALSQGPT